MENEILLAQENSEKLNREIEKGAEKLKTAEEHCDMLEKSNQSLRLEAENLLQRIAMKDQALLEKHAEIERLQTLMPEEHSDFWEILGHEIGLLKSENGHLVKLAQFLVLER